MLHDKAVDLGLSLLSIIVCGISGQTFRMSGVIPPGVPIMFEADAEDCEYMPLLNCLNSPEFSVADSIGPSTMLHLRPTSCLLFMSEQMDREYSDSDVLDGLCTDMMAMGIVVDAHRAKKLMPRPALPYLHTKQSLETMSQVHHRLMRFLQNGYKGTLPVVLVGETGCGKTYLLKKLIELYRPLLNDNAAFAGQKKGNTWAWINTLNHARDVASIRKYCHAKRKAACEKDADLFFVTLDELNTSPALDFCKRLLYEGRFDHGRSKEAQMPRNICLLATCNPSGAYDVFPLPPSIRHIEIASSNLGGPDRQRLVRSRLDCTFYAEALLAAQELHLFQCCIP